VEGEQRSLLDEAQAAQLTLDGGFVAHGEVVSRQEELERRARERAARERREAEERKRPKPMDPALMQPLPGAQGPDL